MTTTTMPEQERDIVARVPKQLYIAGAWRDGTGGRTLGVEDPSTGEMLCDVADATPEDAMAALDAACAMQAEWGRTPPRDRGEILRRAFEELTERTEELAVLMTLEMGKPLAEARGEIAYAADYLRWYSEEAVRISGQFAVAANGASRMLTMKQPVGPCILITPWNFPMAMGTRKIGPAVAAGCTMVVKPAKQTPLCMLALADILERAGLPGGVCNVITSSSSGSVMAPLIGDPRTRKLSFTGSTEVGRKLIEQASEQILRVSMELGGNAPFIVFDDADLDAAIEGALLAKMRNIGEACTAANRLLVHETVAPELARRLAERMGAMTIGRGTADGVTVGPLIDQPAVDKVAELVGDAVDRGGRVLTGGGPTGDRGYFFEPTVIERVPGDARVLTEEIFGPVAPITTFATEEEALARANATEYGLVAYFYTQDLKRALRVIEGLDTGMVGVNQGMVSNAGAPFGGVKQSGYGREGGREGIEEYLALKYAAINL